MEAEDDNRIEEGTAMGLGEVLRVARQRKGVSLYEAEHATKIHRRYLGALENDDYEVFSAPVYLRGFLRSYATYLGLDPGEVQGLLKQRYRPPDDVGLRPIAKPLAWPSIVPAVSLILVAFLVVAVGFVYYLYRQYGSSFPIGEVATPVERTAPSSALGTVTPAGRLPIIATPGTRTIVATPTATSRPGVTIAIKVTEKSWVQVEVDGQVAFSDTLLPGAEKTWQAKEKIFILSGNAGGIQVSHNGRKYEPLGARGEVVRITWTATD